MARPANPTYRGHSAREWATLAQRMAKTAAKFQTLAEQAFQMLDVTAEEPPTKAEVKVTKKKSGKTTKRKPGRPKGKRGPGRPRKNA